VDYLIDAGPGADLVGSDNRAVGGVLYFPVESFPALHRYFIFSQVFASGLYGASDNVALISVWAIRKSKSVVLAAAACTVNHIHRSSLRLLLAIVTQRTWNRGKWRFSGVSYRVAYPTVYNLGGSWLRGGFHVEICVNSSLVCDAGRVAGEIRQHIGLYLAGGSLGSQPSRCYVVYEFADVFHRSSLRGLVFFSVNMYSL
jgi:hypothetical protein